MRPGAGRETGVWAGSGYDVQAWREQAPGSRLHRRAAAMRALAADPGATAAERETAARMAAGWAARAGGDEWPFAACG